MNHNNESELFVSYHTNSNDKNQWTFRYSIFIVVQFQFTIIIARD